MRSCCGCGRIQNKHDLLRIVRLGTREFEIDVKQNKAGRGAYVCRTRTCIEAAIHKKGFHQSFRQIVPSEFYRQLIEFVNAEK